MRTYPKINGLDGYQDLSNLAWKSWQDIDIVVLATWSNSLVASDLVIDGKVDIGACGEDGSQ